MAYHRLTAFVCVAQLVVAHGREFQVEIQFEPMVMGSAMGATRSPSFHKAVNNLHQGAASLDDIFKMLADGVGEPPRPMLRRGGRAGGRRGQTDSLDDFLGTPMVISGPSSLPDSLLRDLFPGPLAVSKAVDHPQPFEHVDALIDDIVNSMGEGMTSAFRDTILPVVMKSASADRTHDACRKDVNDLCPPHEKSPVHCLGAHRHQVSNHCIKEVEKSVPFRCSSYIDKFCDLLQGGILACLKDHMHELDNECRDSVVVTQKVISKAKTEKASVVDPITGSVSISMPAVVDHSSKLVFPKSQISFASVLTDAQAVFTKTSTHLAQAPLEQQVLFAVVALAAVSGLAFAISLLCCSYRKAPTFRGKSGSFLGADEEMKETAPTV